MVSISMDNANDLVDMSNGALVQFQRGLGGSATSFTWLADTDTVNPPLADIDINGTGFTYSSSGTSAELTAGTITSIAIDAGNDNGSENAGDLQITNTAALVGSNIDKDSARSFWNEVLKGNDGFSLRSLETDPAVPGTNIVFGDDLAATSAPQTGGNDSFVAGNNNYVIIGDVATVAGTAGSPVSYTGGDDFILHRFAARSATLAGDALTVGAFATLNGGDDSIQQDHSGSSTSGKSPLSGDVAEQTGGTVNGGDDTIISDRVFTIAAGDVGTFSGGEFSGGNDVIVVFDSSGSANGDRLSGDVDTIAAATVSGNLVCGNDDITGSPEDDIISGEITFRRSTSNTIVGGNDFLSGGLGDDRLFGEVAFSALDPLLSVSGGDDLLFGGGRNDELFGQTGDDELDGGSGNDTLDGGDGTDTASYATALAGVLVNLAVAGVQNTLGAGNDSLLAIEDLAGSRFDDALIDNAGTNAIDGGKGSDLIASGLGNDTLIGGAGVDTISYSAQSAKVTVNLTAQTASGTGIGSDLVLLFEDAAGGSANDNLTGNSRANRLDGRDRNDMLSGAQGNDTLTGGSGIDTQTGGAGRDIFDFDTVSESGVINGTRDVIADLVQGVDAIDLSFIDAATGTGGNQDFTFIGAAAFTAEGQLRFFHLGANTIVEVNTTGISGAEMQVRLTGSYTLTAADFLQ